MALYKPGDKFTIVNFKPHIFYRGGVNMNMRSLSGTTQEIESINEDLFMGCSDYPVFSDEKRFYKLKNFPWLWSCEMFEESYEI